MNMIDKAIASGWAQGDDYYFDSRMVIAIGELIAVRIGNESRRAVVMSRTERIDFSGVTATYHAEIFP